MSEIQENNSNVPKANIYEISIAASREAGP